MKGYFFAALAAVLYGTNPVFAVPLYGTGMNPPSVLLFRYLLGIPLLAIIIILRSERLVPHRREILPVTGVGMIMGASSLTLYASYEFMNPGVASTLLFMYPLLTSLIMTAFFHEKFQIATAICLLVMSLGLYLLMAPGGASGVDMTGFGLIFISALSYSIYLVWIKISPALRHIPVFQSLLYQLLAGGLVFLAAIICEGSLYLPQTLFQWGNLLALALFPTILSLLFTIWAIESIGPTPTAIFGALEPITALVLSILILGEPLTLRELAGAALILCATMLVVARRRSSPGH